MAEYHLLTTWDLEAPIQPVWDVIKDGVSQPRWWKYVAGVTELEPNTADGTGGLFQYRWKTALPYTLSFNVRVSRSEPPHLLEGIAEGELNGVGRWELKQMDHFTRVIYDWRVKTTQPWMNLIAPLARPAFVWNHGKVMTEGGQAIARHLGVKCLLIENKIIA